MPASRGRPGGGRPASSTRAWRPAWALVVAVAGVSAGGAPDAGAASGRAASGESARPPTGPVSLAAGRRPLAAAGRVLRRGDFETGDLSQWRTRNGGKGIQSVAENRIRVVRRPVVQGRYAARFEVRQGDEWRSSGGNRAELMHWGGEREGVVRWYAWSTLFPGNYPRVGSRWQIFTQWHADRGGTQPMLAFYAFSDRIGFRTVESGAAGRPSRSVSHWTAPMARGRWHHFALRVRWSASRARGFVELWHNGERVVSRRRVRTLIPGHAAYMKQGLYRAPWIRPTGVVYHDATVMRAG